MFWGSSVVDRHRNNVCLSDKGIEVVVVLRREGGFNAKGTTVDVNKEGKLVGRVGDFGKEEACRYTGFE
jgi:hypothetical protein